MSLLKGKYVDANNPLDGSKIKLNNNQALVGKKADGSAKEIIKVNASDKIEFLDSIQVPSDPTDPNDVAKKSYVDGKIEDAIVNGVTDKAASQNAVFDALALKQNSLGTGTTSQFLRGDLSWQTVALDPDVVYVNDFASLPGSGSESVLYGTKDENKLWRYAQTGAGLTPDWTVGATGDFATLDAAIASGSVVNGDVISVQAGTYTVSSTLVISKELKIVGAGIGSTILQTAGTGSDPTTMISVTANNVLLKDLTIKHRKSTNTSVETALSVSAGAFPTFTYVSGFIMDTCRVEYCEFGVVVRGDGFKIANSQIAYATGTVGNSNRCIGIYGSRGNCFIQDNVFDNSSLNSTAFRPIYSTSTNSSSNETCSGKLVIDGNSHLGLLQQFYNQDNIRGTNGDFELYLIDNTTNETSLFAGLYITTANQADLFSQIVATGNSISNNHETGTGLGKGLIAIDGAGAALSYRSAALPIHASGNTLAQLSFRADYSAAVGSSGSLVGYKPSVFSTVTVAQDSSIPSTPAAPSTPGGVTYGYVEMSEAPAVVEDAIVNGVLDKAPSQNAVYDALQLKLSTSLKGAVNGLAELDAAGKIPSAQLPAIAISETSVVASEAAMLALTAQKGDVAVRTDLNKSFILAGTDPTVLGDWQELLTPTDAVISVNGQTGSVSLDSDDIAEGSTNKYFSAAAAKSACVSDSITDGVTDVAPSQNAVFDALAGKAADSHSHVAADITDFGSAAKSAAVADSITDGVTDVAPSQNAVYDALAGKAASSHTHVAADVTDFGSAAKTAAVVNSTAGSETDQAASVSAMKSYVGGEIAAVLIPEGKKQRIVLTSTDITNGYVDLSFQAMANTMMVSTGGVVHNEGSGDDYTVSVVGGVSRVTFEPDFKAILAAGDDIYFQYLVLA